jgi:hypothetical protein
MALGTDVAVVSASAALTGVDSSMAHAVVSAVRVASLGVLVDKLLKRINWVVAFIKIVTLFNRYLVIDG